MAQRDFVPAVGVVQRVTDPSKTGLPDQLKNGIESLSGYDLSDVKVHYNSSEPSKMDAHAFAQGTDIHVGPGQEQHLPHEAWHVVQQKQGRVKSTITVNGMPVNDDESLEKEADAMGSQAIQAAGLRRERQVMGTVLTQMMMAGR